MKSGTRGGGSGNETKKKSQKTAIDKRESMRIANQVKVCSFFIILFCYSSFGKVRAGTFAHDELLSAEGGRRIKALTKFLLPSLGCCKAHSLFIGQGASSTHPP